MIRKNEQIEKVAHLRAKWSTFFNIIEKNISKTMNFTLWQIELEFWRIGHQFWRIDLGIWRIEHQFRRIGTAFWLIEPDIHFRISLNSSVICSTNSGLP